MYRPAATLFALCVVGLVRFKALMEGDGDLVTYVLTEAKIKGTDGQFYRIW